MRLDGGGMLSWEAKRRLWVAVRNAPLVTGAVNAAVFLVMWLADRPRHLDEATPLAVCLSIGLVLTLLARFAPWYALRLAAAVFGGIPAVVFGFSLLFMSEECFLKVVGAVVVGAWGMAFHCVAFVDRAWSGSVVRPGHCVNCGYDRCGLAEGAACPECGAR
jgi:hypothetical protein